MLRNTTQSTIIVDLTWHFTSCLSISSYFFVFLCFQYYLVMSCLSYLYNQFQICSFARDLIWLAGYILISFEYMVLLITVIYNENRAYANYAKNCKIISWYFFFTIRCFFNCPPSKRSPNQKTNMPPRNDRHQNVTVPPARAPELRH